MYQVIWTELAKDTYAELIDELMELSLELAIEVNDKVEKLTDALSNFKHLCPSSSKIPRYRRCVVTKQTSLLYEVRKNMVFIIAVIDNRAEHLYF